jgi:hypothetical protein
MRQSVIALNCFGHVDEVEALVAFVAGPEFSYITRRRFQLLQAFLRPKTSAAESPVHRRERTAHTRL